MNKLSCRRVALGQHCPCTGAGARLVVGGGQSLGSTGPYHAVQGNRSVIMVGWRDRLPRGWLQVIIALDKLCVLLVSCPVRGVGGGGG